eukprot:NODE_150_length_1335_cov_437.507450_g146_i0.p1 GENE.NODE_150_length_1335_cov_437.507450_g146_i0~~NODE_150_length_1335_cov_437.507450_g146_i0.p1  ORF type:complete len:295 (-),score=69.17 NODE_150_length_1335_cov_437.507450_g146_i0:365-1249(-)
MENSCDIEKQKTPTDQMQLQDAETSKQQPEEVVAENQLVPTTEENKLQEIDATETTGGELIVKEEVKSDQERLQDAILIAKTQPYNKVFKAQYYHDVVVIPDDIDRLKQIHTLYLDNNYNLEEIPDSIRELAPNLSTLKLGYCKLTDLPAGLFWLRHLRVLDLNNNCLQTIPPDIYRMERIESIDLSSNYIRALPPGLERCITLKRLDLINNPLLHYEDDLSDLQDLPMSKHQKMCDFCGKDLPADPECTVAFRHVADQYRLPLAYWLCSSNCLSILCETKDDTPIPVWKLQYD